MIVKSKNGLGVCIGLAVLLSVVMWNFGNSHGVKQSDEKASKLLKSLNDTLVSYKDKEGKNASYISTIIADRNTLLDDIDERNAEIRELLSNPKVNTVTKIKTITKFDSILIADSIGEDCRADFQFDNNFVAADISVHRDTLKIKSLIVRNDLLISHKVEKDKTIIHIKQSNPYTETTYIKDYIIQNPKQQKNRWLRNLLIGIGIGAVATSLVH